MSHALLHPSRWVSHLRLCTVTKEEGKTRDINVYLLINSIACNELTTACRVWYLKSLKACTLFISYWLICQETRNEVEVNTPRLLPPSWFIGSLCSLCQILTKDLTNKMLMHVMFGSLKSLKACTAHINHWLICHEIRNKEGVNAPCLSVLGLFGFCKMTYTPRCTAPKCFE